MHRVSHMTATAVVALIALMTPAPSAAQWGATTYGVAEYDTNEVLFTLLGVSVSPGGEGIKPIASLQAYRLSYDAGTQTNTIWAVRPAVGLKSSFRGGSLQAQVGYSIQDEDVDAPLGVFIPDGGTDGGVTLSGHYDYWGTGGPLAGQAIASYNFGSESLWARGRLTAPLMRRSDGGQLRFGGEVALLNSENITAWQPGGLVEWHTAGGLILIGGAGQKLYDEGENATYFKAEFVLPIG